LNRIPELLREIELPAGKIGYYHDDEGDRAVVYLGEPIYSGYVLRGGRQTGPERLHIRGVRNSPRAMSNSKAPSHSPMTFTFTPTFAQQYRAILTTQVQSRGLLLVNLLFPASGVVLLLLAFGRLHRAPSLWEWTIVALCFGFTPLLTAQNLFLVRRKNATVGGSQTYVFDESGINIRGPNFQVHLDWPAIYRVVETGSLFLFYLSPRVVHFLPKSAVSGSQALEELRRLLHQQTGTRARLLLSPTELPSSLASG